jgi:hypothetical protein
MASKQPTKEELAQVRRMRAQKPWVSPEVIIQAAARTPNITRFIHAKQRRLRPVSSEVPPIITSPETTFTTRYRRSSARSVQANLSSRDDEIKVSLIAHEVELANLSIRFPSHRQNGFTTKIEFHLSVPLTVNFLFPLSLLSQKANFFLVSRNVGIYTSFRKTNLAS